MSGSALKHLRSEFLQLKRLGLDLLVVSFLGMVSIPNVMAWRLHIAQQSISNFVPANKNSAEGHDRLEPFRENHHARLADHDYSLGQVILSRREIQRDITWSEKG
jgi:hypothetical protein